MVRDLPPFRKEKYGLPENAACHGEDFLGFIIFSGYRFTQFLHRVGDTSNLEWKRRTWANTNRLHLCEKATSQPDLSPRTLKQQFQQNPSEQSRVLTSPSPIFSLTFIWIQLYLFILRTLSPHFTGANGPFTKDNLHGTFWKAVIEEAAGSRQSGWRAISGNQKVSKEGVYKQNAAKSLPWLQITRLRQWQISFPWQPRAAPRDCLPCLSRMLGESRHQICN